MLNFLLIVSIFPEILHILKTSAQLFPIHTILFNEYKPTKISLIPYKKCSYSNRNVHNPGYFQEYLPLKLSFSNVHQFYSTDPKNAVAITPLALNCSPGHLNLWVIAILAIMVHKRVMFTRFRILLTAGSSFHNKCECNVHISRQKYCEWQTSFQNNTETVNNTDHTSAAEISTIQI